MKGRNPTQAEQQFHHDLAGLGCIACRLDGFPNPWVSIHHVDGRTKEWAHWLCLALCAEHHQQNDADPLHRIAVHPNQGKFERRYGNQMTLLALSLKLLGGNYANRVKESLQGCKSDLKRQFDEAAAAQGIDCLDAEHACLS